MREHYGGKQHLGVQTRDGTANGSLSGESLAITFHLTIVRASGGWPADWARIPSEASRSDRPRWSPDGRMLNYVANVSRPFCEVCAAAVDTGSGRVTGTPVRITHFDRANFALVSDH